MNVSPDSHSTSSSSSSAQWDEPSRRSLTDDKRTAEDVINTMDADVRDSLTAIQLSAVRELVAAALPKPSPKIVDLRFGIDLLISRFYIVLFVGKDRRQSRRSYVPSPVTRIGNVIVAIALLVGINVLISMGIFLLAYLTKSAVGIDLFPDSHLSDQMQKF